MVLFPINSQNQFEVAATYYTAAIAALYWHIPSKIPGLFWIVLHAAEWKQATRSPGFHRSSEMRLLRWPQSHISNTTCGRQAASMTSSPMPQITPQQPTKVCKTIQ
jgi:hypothetical protein